MKTKIRYSILKYIHSRVYNESLNVGVFVEYPERQKYDLFIPSDLSRLSSLYTDFRQSFLKSYLATLKRRTDELNNRQIELIEPESDYSDIKSFILRRDDTSLEFGEVREAQIKHQSLVKNFVSGFVPHLFDQSEKKHKHDEPYLKSRFYRAISTLKGVENKVKRDQELTFNHLTFKVDFEWQNGTTNLVKAVSFDLQDASSINNKIAQTSGYLNHFSTYIAENNSRFDLLVSQPTDKRTYKDYDRAIQILDSINVNKQIIEEKGLEKYSHDALSYLSQ